MTNNVPISVDYTSRDYYSLRNDLINNVRRNVSTWQGTDPADFGVVLVEAFAYMGDIMSYYIDRIANESYIGTATQRQSILNIAKTYGYYPNGYSAATMSLKFTNTTSEAISIPIGTILQTEIASGDSIYQLPYTTTSDITLLANESIEFQIAQQEDISTRTENLSEDKNGEILGTSYGIPGQQFTLRENNVVDGSVRVYVNNGTTWDEWRNITHITDAGPSDPVFTLTTDSNNFVCVTFGDGVSGYIPPKDNVILATYSVTYGKLGNINDGTVFTFYRFPTDLTPEEIDTITQGVELSAATLVTLGGVGGSDPEDNDTIRKNAPKALTALNRAVTLQDFANLSLLVPSVGKASADAAIWNSVTVYVAPQQTTTGTTTADAYPGYSGTPNNLLHRTTSMVNIISSVSAYLADKTQIGTTVTVSAPTYIPANLTIRYTKLPNFTNSDVEKNINTALFDIYSYGNRDFAEVITPESIESNLRYVAGVSSIQVMYLSRITTLDAQTPATSGGTATITTATPHNLTVGDIVEITGFGSYGTSSTAVTAAPTSTTFSIATATTGASGAAGTVSATVRKPLIGAPSEIFTFEKDNVNLAYLSSVASLSSLTGPTLVPSFSSTFFNYNVSTSSSSIAFTPVASSGGSVTVNGTLVTAGNPSVTVSTPSGLTVVNIVVTSADGVYGATYKVNVTH